MSHEWSDETMTILDKIRQNSIVLNKYYKKKHLDLHGQIKYFKLPIIVMSSISGVASVGLNGYGITQSNINAIICLLSLTTSIIGSVELFLGIHEQAEVSLILYKEWYLLATDIYKITKLKESDRGTDGIRYLDEVYSKYTELIRKNGVFDIKTVNDKLLNLDDVLQTPLSSPLSLKMKSFDSEVDLAFQIDNIKEAEKNGVEMV
jgi:hypothetical protein